MKAIIPVAGAGTRLRPFTYSQPKALIPIAGKPMLSYIIEELQEAEVEEFIFIVGYLGDKIIDFVNTTYPHLKSHFVHQLQREGLAQAVSLCKQYISPSDEIVIVLGDSIIDVDFKEIIQLNKSILGVKKVDDPSKFGVAEVNANGTIKSLVEKPLIPKSNLALVGLYIIKETAVLMECINSLIENNRKTNSEFQLTDALMCMIQKGVELHSYKVENWFDVGQGDILLQTNAQLLKKFGRVDPKAQVENTIIVEPVSIAANCKITDSIIGPNVTIGENAVIRNSIIRDTIIGNYTTLVEMTLNNSVIGSDASMKGLSQRLNIGDNTEIDFSK
ncbi:MAG: NTP transferase domain-containing protein [Bacteroidetes bacterium]|nr:NTP transferase domain-containing protein [Bacteroidota bacterium]MBP7477574.1 NTP transferase domain-containing protein [Chitinophagales bacterium]